MIGFSIQQSEEQEQSTMAQSHIIDAMFETSEQTRSSRPNAIRISRNSMSSSTLQPLYKSNMGQRLAIFFMGANLSYAYCSVAVDH